MTDVVENQVDTVTWQGQLSPEDQKNADAQFTGKGIKLRSAGRQLLVELVRPYRRRIIGVLLIVLGQVAATMAGPFLVGVAIDKSLPDARHGDYGSLAFVGGGLVVAAGLSGALRSLFVMRSGAIGQDILYDLRRRGYDHIQALSVAFHERFTSGRVISRLTSDVDTLTELLDSGLDGLLTALFNSVAIGVILIVLDPPLAAIALASLIPLWLLYRWFSPRAAKAFTRTREKVATMIVSIVETFNGIRAVQAFRRERRNDAIFAGLNDGYREANREINLAIVVFPAPVAPTSATVCPAGMSSDSSGRTGRSAR